MKFTNGQAMKYYLPEEEGMGFNQVHTLIYTFQYEDAFAQILTTMGGNVSGGSVMVTEFDTGMTVPTEHELTKKHVIFLYDDDKDFPNREVGQLIFHYPDGGTLLVDLEDCGNHLVGIQIIDYKSS